MENLELRETVWINKIIKKDGVNYSMLDREKQQELLEKLRGHLAYKSNRPPYAIFDNEEMETLLRAQPKSVEELAGLKGFPKGGKRVSAWGEAIVAVFTKTEEVKDFDVSLDSDGDPVAKVSLKSMNIF